MFKRTLPTVIAISAGLLVLLGTFFPDTVLYQARHLLIQWAILISVFAFIIAFLHFSRVHLSHLSRMRADTLSSLAVMTTALIAFLLVMLPGQGPTGEWTQILLNTIMIPGESALLALTAVTLLLAVMRMMRQRRSFGALLFIIIIIVILVGTVPYSSVLGEIVAWIQRVPAMAGMRGLLIGVAIGITMTGLRVISGASRPHSDD